jgi:tetratricopeptide (TPR) repeat protein
MKIFLFLIPCFSLVLGSCTSTGVTSAEEYYSLGMAFYDLGKFEDAEKWLNRARMVDKTKTASEYNLGRIAFEQKRYEDAAKHFERILVRDPENVLALKAAAYTRIRIGDIAVAEGLYDRILKLIPESFDDGYNYAMVLYVMEKPEKTEEVLRKYEAVLEDNKDALLLLARAQGAQDKVEAADTYSKWLASNTDHKVRYEYAQVLEKGEFYAKALEEYRLVLTSLPAGAGTTPAETPVKADASTTPAKTGAATTKETQAVTEPDPLAPAQLRFTIARLLFIADGESEEGAKELTQAVAAGFTDIPALEALLEDKRIIAARKDDIRRIIGEMRTAETARLEKEKAAAEEAAKVPDAGTEKQPEAEGGVPGETEGTPGSAGEGENPR